MLSWPHPEISHGAPAQFFHNTPPVCIWSLEEDRLEAQIPQKEAVCPFWVRYQLPPVTPEQSKVSKKVPKEEDSANLMLCGHWPVATYWDPFLVVHEFLDRRLEIRFAIHFAEWGS